MKEELVLWRKAITDFFKYLNLQYLNIFIHDLGKQSRSMLLQCASAMYSMLYQVMATFHLKYIKGHMDFFSLHDNLLLPKQLGFWPTLHHCSSQACRKRAEHKPVLGRLSEYAGKAAASSL